MAYTVIVGRHGGNTEPEPYFLVPVRKAEHAIDICRELVDGELERIARAGHTQAELFDLFVEIGPNPFIRSDHGVPLVEFSAWDYAAEQVPLVLARIPSRGRAVWLRRLNDLIGPLLGRRPSKT